MREVVFPGIAVVFSILCLYDPKLYRKFFAPLCLGREEDLPPFPRSAALGMLLFLGFEVFVPESFRLAGSKIWISPRLLYSIVTAAFLIIGIGLTFIPRECIRILKWPQPQNQAALFVCRLVGIGLVAGSAAITVKEILHR
jgi:uncharacterized membrane protein